MVLRWKVFRVDTLWLSVEHIKDELRLIILDDITVVLSFVFFLNSLDNSNQVCVYAHVARKNKQSKQEEKLSHGKPNAFEENRFKWFTWKVDARNDNELMNIVKLV